MDQSRELIGSKDVVPYRRGLAIGPILKGVVARFLPGSLTGTGALALIFDLSAQGGAVATAGIIAGLGAAMTAGYGIALLGMRRWLFPDARPDSLRSFLAGVLAPFAIFVALVADLGFDYLPILSVVIGMLCALGLFLAWLTPTPEEVRDHRFLGESTSADDPKGAS